MKILILSHNLSENCLGRAYLLADILKRHHDVLIAGPIKGELWKPLKNQKEINFLYLKENLLEDIKVIYKLDYDLIYSIKPKFYSYGLGLLMKILKRKPLILDIDDWETGLSLSLSKLGLIYFSLVPSYDNPVLTFFLEKLAKISDSITVSSTFLQKKFGGYILPHARDEILVTQNIGRKNKKIINVFFLGTPRKHKGIEILIRAYLKMDNAKIKLNIVGGNEKNLYYMKVKDKYREKIKFYSDIDFKKMPLFLSKADIVVIPQLLNLATVGQIPAKIFDAMALGKAIISTNVSDIPEILSGCGIVIPPNDVDKLREAIEYLANNKQVMCHLGEKAKKKFIKKYSYKVVYPLLNSLLDKVSLDKNRR